MYIIQTLMEGGILCDDLMYRPGARYTEDEAKCVLKQVLEGLHYLHSR